MKRLLLVLLFISVSSVVSAQTVPEVVVSWDVSFWSAGVNPDTGSPISTSNFTKAGAQCNQPLVPAPTLPVVNPTKISLDDPDVAGRSCILGPTTSSGVLMALPLGNGIFATVIGRGATLQSARSAVSNPFNRAIVPAPPIVPTSLRVSP
jgi:hypothetical protein